ncbi:unnamed protein product [Ostreobium quekettii]|uniref:Uncharacterized protein n=1 Tax=Ostreobium quekettii TaxID=121088 RepID=A0A8S1IUK6_9CHLO|nr:unnamed protein product [Ostreobium quekettii]
MLPSQSPICTTAFQLLSVTAFLRCLKLEHCPAVSEGPLLLFLAHCVNLEVLSLRRNVQVGISTFTEALFSMPTLRVLLMGGTGMEDGACACDTWTKPMEGLQNLRKIEVPYNCMKITAWLGCHFVPWVEITHSCGGD